MLRYIAARQLPYRITLVYSNRDRESTPFFDELGELEERIEGLRVVLTMTDDPDWEGETRHIDAEMLREHLGDLDGRTFFVAGPPGMAEGVEKMLHEAGLPEDLVQTDSFSGY
jgi:ferredoxin-NADP reductase